jgi:hypothetical protein
MDAEPDPYRTLGLSRGASLDEVKRAYRRLVKANHPDAAGEGALPRFLAIQAAYDLLVGPGASASAGVGAARRSSAQRRPWGADPDRADATRRAYGGRARRARTASGTRRAPGPPPADERQAQDGAGDPDASTTGAADRPPKRATMGSTSYDGADIGPFEPDWGGASWYGTTTGTYWRLNPKEYADPRKHGPEYQARARRAGPRDAAGATTGTAAATTAHPSEPIAPDATSGDSAGATPDPAPSHTTASWWEATTGDPAPGPGPGTGAPRSGRGWAPPAPDTAPDMPPAEPAQPALDRHVAAARTWLAEDRPGPISRVGRAAIGWAPIALGIGWLAGEITGCGRFSATCDAGTAPIAWFAQVVVLALFLVVPPLARIGAIAAVATLMAAVPATLVLSATGGSGDSPTGRATLAVVLVVAWLVGIAFAVAREFGAIRDLSTADPAPSDGDRPVS